MHSLHFTAQTSSDAVVERHFFVAPCPNGRERPATAEDERARGEPAPQVTPKAALDALQRLPEVGTEAPIGYGGGISLGTAIGVPLTAVEPRITAALFGGGFFVYDALLEAARRITIPIQFLLPWDDEYVDRQSGLSLFDAFATSEKTLHANPGDHRSIRWGGVDTGFLARHLGRAVGAETAAAAFAPR
jgi:hypothetical protein